MTVNAYATEFFGRRIEPYDPAVGITDPRAALRLAIDYEAAENGGTVAALIETLARDPRAGELEAIVIGPWTFEQTSSEPEVAALVAARERFASLRAVFFGDITYEDQEISWIEQSDMAPLLSAYPKLEALRVRGGNSLAFSRLDHAGLRELAVETGGLPRALIAKIFAGHLPNLERLELWLGDDGYGGDSTVDDLAPVLSGRLFPRLKHLGLRNSQYTDGIARAVANAPVLAQLESLDLSMGTLGDEGAQALLESAMVKRLRALDVSHHYVSPEALARLAALPGVQVTADDPQTARGEDRYVAVSE